MATIEERWFFYQDSTALWRWARLDLFGTVLERSPEGHQDRDDCVADAGRHGYRFEARGPSPVA